MKAPDPSAPYCYMSTYQFLCLQVSLVFARCAFQVSFHGVCLYPHLFACLFVLSLCSAAELTRRHFAWAASMVQLKRVISQNALMMVVVLELTGLHRDMGRERGKACCEVLSAAYQCCGSVAPLQTAGRVKLALFSFCLEKGKRPASQQQLPENYCFKSKAKLCFR